jgi:hypothetical protein
MLLKVSNLCSHESLFNFWTRPHRGEIKLKLHSPTFFVTQKRHILWKIGPRWRNPMSIYDGRVPEWHKQLGIRWMKRSAQTLSFWAHSIKMGRACKLWLSCMYVRLWVTFVTVACLKNWEIQLIFSVAFTNVEYLHILDSHIWTYIHCRES